MEDIHLIEQYYAAQARENLWAFRQFMDPNLIKGWFPYDISTEFQNFYEMMLMGLRPKLVLMAPPQHGKTRNLQDFVGWAAGKQPNWRTIYASYSDDLGVTTNRYLQKMFDDRKYKLVFPQTRINADNTVTVAGRPLRNSSIIEYAGHKGFFRNATVQGQINGKSLDLGIIDDPMKGREEAQSKVMRDKTWAWLTDDFFSRFSEHAGMIITMTRWHVDDPIGRFLEMFPDAIILQYPAEATCDTEYRHKGDPLFPQFKSKAFLEERKKLYTTSGWMSLYQQSPINVGGGIFPLDRAKFISFMPEKVDIKRSVRYWDKAGTDGGGAYTSGVLMHLLTDGRVVIEDVVRGQWGAFEREKRIKATAERDKAMVGRVHIWIEQEPGSGGKESAERTIANLRGFIVSADRVTGSKETRAEPYAAQFQGGNVLLLARDWTRAFLDEHESFPTGKYKDQVDAAAGAFAKVVFSKRYNINGLQ